MSELCTTCGHHVYHHDKGACDFGGCNCAAFSEHDIDATAAKELRAYAVTGCRDCPAAQLTALRGGYAQWNCMFALAPLHQTVPPGACTEDGADLVSAPRIQASKTDLER